MSSSSASGRAAPAATGGCKTNRTFAWKRGAAPEVPGPFLPTAFGLGSSALPVGAAVTFAHRRVVVAVSLLPASR